MTVLEVIQKSTEFLAKKGVESPRLQTELLLAHRLKLPRMRLYLNFERALTPAELDGFRELVKRRSRREPLQHIVGSTSFCGLEMTVDRRALVPRPETEILAELGWQFLLESTLQRAPEQPEGWTPTAFDLGTGSGCLAIALAVKCPAARVWAGDISPEALELAKQNAARNNVAARIEFFPGDGFTALPEVAQASCLSGSNTDRTGKLPVPLFDLIISNPPYIPSAEIAALQPEVRDYDPRRALDGGPDGLDFFRRLASEAGGFLKPGGRVMVEFGDGQAGALRTIFESQKWIVEAVKEDYSHRARILIAFKL
jgi:release factor glutamine methyltransferase